MRYVRSGYGYKIPLLSLVAILSISLTVNLPGLAISPLLDKIKDVFPDCTELETQMLVTLPNFVIIPFILLGGRLSNPRNQMKILAGSLIIYTACGILFLFAKTMVELIVLSCLLGVGCGPVIPLAGSLIAQHFAGPQRTHQLGMKSGISNFMVIFATLFVGWVAAFSWHLAFLVYLVPIIPLCLITYMNTDYIMSNKLVIKEHREEEFQGNKVVPDRLDPKGTEDPVHDALEPPEPPRKANPAPKYAGRVAVILLLGLIGVYVTMTFSVMAVGDYLPFTMEHYGDTSAAVGLATALFYLGATLGGFTLSPAIRLMGRATPYISIAVVIGGLWCIGFIHVTFLYMVAALVAGYGYGIIQPIIYDKTAQLAPDADASTKYFGYTLTGNYIAIAIAPFIVSLFTSIFSAQKSVDFPFIFNGCVVTILLIVAFFKSKSFVFTVTRDRKLRAPKPAPDSASSNPKP